MPDASSAATAAHSGGERLTAAKILVVDDEPQIRLTLHRFLSRLGYFVAIAGSVPEALGLLADSPCDLLLTDLRLPGPSGLDLIGEVRTRWPATRAILMSANADIPAAAAAIQSGVDSLLEKPFGLATLQARVEDSLARLRAAADAERSRAELEAKLIERDDERGLLVLRAAHALVAAVEAKDAYTAGHSCRVAEYAMAIRAVTGGIDPVRFRLAGDLHDIGKIGVPDNVLTKPGRLTPEEFALVQRHPEAGSRILEPLIDDPLVLGVVRWHHERWDGSGYPHRLRGEEIPVPARILAVADTLDAMTSRRAYRDGLPWDVALTEIRRCSGSQFDPAVVAAFEQALPALAEIHRRSRLATLLPTS